MNITNLEIDKSISAVYGKLNGCEFGFNFSIDGYDLKLKDETFYDIKDDPITLQPQVLKEVKQHIHEWFIQQDEWHELTSPEKEPAYMRRDEADFEPFNGDYLKRLNLL
tara:strand:- start:448 stop:774 length:327 start_codon:yes stop_codon:yes gene_type:complete